MHHYKKVVDNKHYGGVYEHYTKLMRINTAYTAKGGTGGGGGGGGGTFLPFHKDKPIILIWENLCSPYDILFGPCIIKT